MIHITYLQESRGSWWSPAQWREWRQANSWQQWADDGDLGYRADTTNPRAQAFVRRPDRAEAAQQVPVRREAGSVLTSSHPHYLIAL